MTSFGRAAQTSRSEACFCTYALVGRRIEALCGCFARDELPWWRTRASGTPKPGAQGLPARRRRGGTNVSDAPDGAASVVAHQQRAVGGDCDADWPSPHLPGLRDEARQEVLVFT